MEPDYMIPPKGSEMGNLNENVTKTGPIIRARDIVVFLAYVAEYSVGCNTVNKGMRFKLRNDMYSFN
jgi:hypothetical protein